MKLRLPVARRHLGQRRSVRVP